MKKIWECREYGHEICMTHPSKCVFFRAGRCGSEYSKSCSAKEYLLVLVDEKPVLDSVIKNKERYKDALGASYATGVFNQLQANQAVIDKLFES